MKIYIWGYLHQCGGAGPETGHAIELFRDNGVEVTCVVPQGTDVLSASEPRRRYLDSLGVATEAYSPGMFNDQNVWCWCEDTLFEHLIRNEETPRQVVYWPCMNDFRDRELVAIAKIKNLRILCQTSFQLGQLTQRINDVGISADLSQVHPFFNLDSKWGKFRFSDKPLDRLNVIRIGRDNEPFKYPRDMWDLFYKVTTPNGVTSKLFVIGWGEEGERLLGNIGDPSNPYFGKINAEVIPHIYSPSELANHFRDAHAHLMFYPFHENAPRAMFEAMACGSIIVGPTHGGIPEFIRDQETGFLVSSNDEASHRLSQLAFSPKKARRMAEQALDSLKNGIGCPKCAFARFSKEFR